MYMRNLNKQIGFTLIELLMVLLIIAATTKIVAVSMEDFGFAARYEHTISRLDTIRQAIIGNPKRTVNGQPDISGFVADMGRLPNNVRELIQRNGDCDDDAFDFGQAACAASGATWIAATWTNVPASFTNDETGLVFGWNGPYLSVSDNPSNTDTFTDGWGNESADNYGWVTCLWDDGDDTAGGGLDNNLPNDTDTAPADGFANCTNSQNHPNYTIYSLGRDGVGEVDSNGETTCNSDNNTYDGDCYTTILEPDYAVDITDGLSVSFLKKRSNQGGSCAFNGEVASIYASEKNSCLNAGGARAPSCRYTSSSCGTAGGIWNLATFYCDFDSASCDPADSDPDITWDAATSTCHITKSQCGTDAGTWTGRIPCAFDYNSCSTATGSTTAWDSETHTCKFTSATCTSATGSATNWDATTSSCDITPTQCNAFTGAIWGCGINTKSCYASGGLWRECQLAPAECTAAGGINASPYNKCDFSRLSCLNVNGTWNATTRKCAFTSTTCPAGSSWNGSGCDFSGTQCSDAGGHNKNFCDFTSANCSAAGGSYDSGAQLCSFAPSACAAKHGISFAQDCAMTNREGENFGPKFFPTNCEVNNGIWRFNTKTICLNVFHRGRIDSSIVTTSSNPVTIEENGSYQTLSFSFDRGNQADCESNMGEWVNSSCTYSIAMGINAVGIYEYDGDCNTDNNLYPYDRAQPVPIQIIPNTNLPIINW